MSSNKMPEQYSLKWNNFHTNLTTGFHGLFEDEDLVDVSLAVEGKIIQAHKVILSVCSPYFKSLFRIHPEKHPIVFLKDVGYSEVIGLLQFMYQGQVDVSQEQLAEFLRVAEMLQVKGLTSNSDSEPSNNSITPDIEEPMIPQPVLSSLSNKVNNISNNNTNNTSQNNALKRKKPSPTSSTPVDGSEPIFKIVNVESLKKPKLVSEDALAPASTNGISSTREQDANCDSPTYQGDLPLIPTVHMIPKMEPVEEYSETTFTDYSDIGENFMSHFMEEPSSDSSPQPSQQNYASFNQPQSASPKSSASSPAAAASATASSDGSPGNTGSAATPVNKLTTQQIMNIDVSLLQGVPKSTEIKIKRTGVEDEPKTSTSDKSSSLARDPERAVIKIKRFGEKDEQQTSTGDKPALACDHESIEIKIERSGEEDEPQTSASDQPASACDPEMTDINTEIFEEENEPQPSTSDQPSLARVPAMVTDLYKVCRRIEKKVDKILPSFITVDHSCTKMLDILPVKTLEQFQDLENHTKNEREFHTSFRSHLRTVGGSSLRSLVFNMLRRLVTDELATKISLTGKSHENAKKREFQGTQIYSILVDVAIKKFQVDEDTIRKPISDWFNQSNTRLSRKNERERQQ